MSAAPLVVGVCDGGDGGVVAAALPLSSRCWMTARSGWHQEVSSSC